jgi:hypothetical protein
MRALTLAFAAGLTLAASVQAAPLAPQPNAIELSATTPRNWSPEAAGGAGTGTIGKTVGKPAKGPLR